MNPFVIFVPFVVKGRVSILGGTQTKHSGNQPCLAPEAMGSGALRKIQPAIHSSGCVTLPTRFDEAQKK